jgi:dihydrofolate reductase
MAKVSYSGIMSLDGYIADRDGTFDWSAPDEEVHAFINDQERSVGTALYGRRMYDVLSVWETLPTEGEPTVIADFAALWNATDKIVYSTSLASVTTARTRIERSFDPDAIHELKFSSARDISIGGANFSAQVLRAGLVDELRLYLVPVVVGGGTAFLPDDIRLDLALVDEHRFSAGTVFLRYSVA